MNRMISTWPRSQELTGDSHNILGFTPPAWIDPISNDFRNVGVGYGNTGHEVLGGNIRVPISNYSDEQNKNSVLSREDCTGNPTILYSYTEPSDTIATRFKFRRPPSPNRCLGGEGQIR